MGNQLKLVANSLAQRAKALDDRRIRIMRISAGYSDLDRQMIQFQSEIYSEISDIINNCFEADED